MRGRRSVGGDLSLNFPLFMAKLQQAYIQGGLADKAQSS